MVRKTLFIAAIIALSTFWVQRNVEKIKPAPHSNEAHFQNPSLVQNSYAQTQGTDLSSTVENLIGSIVNISSIKITRYQSSPFFNDPFFEHFFGREFGNSFGVPREHRQKSLGSGVIVSSQGHILTNNHVIDQASEVTVRLSDQTELQAKLVGTDPPTDLALIQVKLPSSFKPILMGNSDELRLAETVLAIGSPFGLGGTVTMGIVSAKGRANVGIVDYEDFIQTDAAINPGNSGGALINLRGQLVGINTAIYSKSGGYQGIGFAIPINMAKFVMSQLITKGQVERGWIGLKYQDITSDIAKALKLERSVGTLVTGVFKNSSAHKAGIQAGDVILKLNGVEIRNSGHFTKLLSEIRIGGNITLNLFRDQKNRQAQLAVKALPQEYINRPARRRR